jgi:anti-sigma B factor antagonist
MGLGLTLGTSSGVRNLFQGLRQEPIAQSPEKRLTTTPVVGGVVVVDDVVQVLRAGAYGEHLIAMIPAEVDISNADELREALLRVLNGNVRTLIIDMSATTFCDVAGVRVLERVHRRAQAYGTQLRLVVGVPGVRRILMLNGLHRILAVYPSLLAAFPRDGRPTSVAGVARARRRAWFTKG